MGENGKQKPGPKAQTLGDLDRRGLDALAVVVGVKGIVDTMEAARDRMTVRLGRAVQLAKDAGVTEPLICEELGLSRTKVQELARSWRAGERES